MKRKTFIRKFEEMGYTVSIQEDGITIQDGFGFRLFVSEQMACAVSTCGAVTLPTTEFNLAVRYARTPLDKR